MIEILSWTTKDPLYQIGYCAGICRDANTELSACIKRAKQCIKSEHGRALEFPNIYFVMSKVSARMVRQFYTHIVGVTRLQASTRYIQGAEGFNIPSNLNREQAKLLSDEYENITSIYDSLIDKGLSLEDAANVLPLGMYTKVVVKINLRALIHMAHERLCSQALLEFRETMIEIKNRLSEISEEWKWICDNLLVSKCEYYKRCNESKSCGRFK